MEVYFVLDTHHNSRASQYYIRQRDAIAKAEEMRIKEYQPESRYLPVVGELSTVRVVPGWKMPSMRG